MRKKKYPREQIFHISSVSSVSTRWSRYFRVGVDRQIDRYIDMEYR